MPETRKRKENFSKPEIYTSNKATARASWNTWHLKVCRQTKNCDSAKKHSREFVRVSSCAMVLNAPYFVDDQCRGQKNNIDCCGVRILFLEKKKRPCIMMRYANNFDYQCQIIFISNAHIKILDYCDCPLHCVLHRGHFPGKIRHLACRYNIDNNNATMLQI